jgi:3-methyladenine DNA glycosylase AlkD
MTIQSDLQKLADPQKAKILSGFFKTAKGEYGEGDRFLGIKVPVLRSVAKKYRDISNNDVRTLLDSEIHEYRMIALIILVDKFTKATKLKEVVERDRQTQAIYQLYLESAKRSRINNWDLVDISAPQIVGQYFHKFHKDRTTLQELAKSGNLWEKRIAIISTQYFIRKGEFEDTLAISEILLNHEHDLIHKAVGWMLREVGNRNQTCEETFLKTRYRTMPRTMLRYAIEKFEEGKRRAYLEGKI